jgi:hypothetical protein
MSANKLANAKSTVFRDSHAKAFRGDAVLEIIGIVSAPFDH